MGRCRWELIRFDHFDIDGIIKRFHSRGQRLFKFIGTKESVCVRRVQLPQDWFGTPIWPPFHGFGTVQYGRRDVMWKHSIRLIYRREEWRHVTLVAKILDLNSKELTKLRRRGQRERQKSSTFNEQNSNSTRASRFLYISLSSLRNCSAKWPNFDLTWGRKRQSDKFYSLSLWTRTQPPLFSSDLTSLLSNNWVTWFNGKKVSKNAKSIFQRRFHWRHRCRMVRSLMFLDRDGHLHCRKREEKNGPTVSSWMQSWTGKLYMSILRLFLQYLRNHALLRSRNSATKATVRDVTVCFVEG